MGRAIAICPWTVDSVAPTVWVSHHLCVLGVPNVLTLLSLGGGEWGRVKWTNATLVLYLPPSPHVHRADAWDSTLSLLMGAVWSDYPQTLANGGKRRSMGGSHVPLRKPLLSQDRGGPALMNR